MKKYTFNNIDYKLERNEKEAFEFEAVEEKFTDFFESYDYVLGDWAYGKLRLKGFYESKNKNVKKYNDIKDMEAYLENNCAYNCKWFLLKKISQNVE